MLSAFPLHLLIALAKGVYSGVEVFFSCIKSLYIFLWNLEYYGFLESGPKNRQTIQISQKMVVSSYSGFVDVVASIQSFEGKYFGDILFLLLVRSQ